ncbi:MAG: TonB-dependent receptor [Saprospiraceae bacterium]|nr:TonB-dependent receptor [Saprospiraceae bacterium]MBK7810923.1 TonB-dependent receptor [Saprospiraceae bacterium]MBK9630527.1 TonB-dependent receptor [Saprospiraceae bacterium]
MKQLYLIFKHFLITLLIIFSISLSAQSPSNDTIDAQYLEEITIKAYRQQLKVLELPDIHNSYLVSGKKNEVIQVKDLPFNQAEKTGRQLFAKIPGAFIYDMDGSGNQVNVSTRGLDPHRGWEFNIRQNGIITNSDMYGYPASHYNVPMEAIDRVEIIRGTGALQYGAQFGGMINYITKKAPVDKKLSMESITSIGSFGLFSSFNSMGGTVGKLSYYAYYQTRTSDGYRNYAQSKSDAQHLQLSYKFSEKLSINAEISRSYYRFRIPGPLTDAMFEADPTQNTRHRNYYAPEIVVPSISMNWKINSNSQLNVVVSGTFGFRNSVLFEGLATKRDTISATNLMYAPRVVDIDQFNSKTYELSLLHKYSIKGIKSHLITGIRGMHNKMSRRQQAPGTTGVDYDLSTTGPFRRDLTYLSNTIAFFVENLIYINKHFTLSPGFRYEYGQSDLSGTIVYLQDADIPNQIKHRIPAFGISGKYTVNPSLRIYGGISQAHRPVILKDIIPASILERADRNLQNATGYVAELGVKANLGDWLRLDLTAFNIQYNNRLGNIFIRENDSTLFTLKTNIGDSRIQGLECYLEITPINNGISLLSIFTSSSLMHSEYLHASLRTGPDSNTNISGNRIESVPKWISRNGIQYAYKNLNLTLQYSYTSESFADPLNTVTPSADGAIGIVPAYGICDLFGSFRFGKNFILRAGVNNLFDKQYFTKRPSFYPGPGIWSSDGRGFFMSVGIKI